MRKYHKIQSVFKRDPETKFKTLIENDFSMPEFEYLADNKWVFTEKVDGTNIRFLWDGENFDIRGKTDNADIPPMLKTSLVEIGSRLKLLFRDKFKKGSDEDTMNVCFYGEGYGNRIQSAGKLYNPKNTSFVLFDININGWWLERENVEEIANEMRLDIVPIIGTGSLWDGIDMVRKGFNSKWGDFIAEGIVARPVIELRSRRGDRIITKIKHKDFL